MTFRNAMLLALLGSGLAGCGSMLPQIDAKITHKEIALDAADLVAGGIGFLTPSAATGREADKQALALSFATRLEAGRTDLRVVPLPAVLSAVNAAELDQEYKQMFRDYLETGILDGALLKRIGEIGQVRYLAQLNLASFEQVSRGRFSLIGLRFVDTKQANIRVFLQIWDSQTGSVAWEGGGEVNYAFESVSERPVTFQQVSATAADRIYAGLPRSAAPP
ncbi:MAG: hypothetical protein JNK40_09880 [Chromatiales bacterium]|nr:hypothetical protein [Chromatiales bacterium]